MIANPYFLNIRCRRKSKDGSKYILVYSLSLLLFFFLGGCIPTGEETPSVDIESGETNNVIILSAPAGCNDYKINSPVCISVELVSEDTVVFRTDSVRIYEFVEGNWETVTDMMEGPYITYIIVPSDVAYYRSATFSVQPALGNRDVPVTLRFIAIGNLYIDEVVGEPVMAYTDVTFYP